MSTPFHLATCALCVKASIPEVEAVIALLSPIVRQELRQVAELVYRELLERLAAFSDSIGAPDIDVLAQAGRDRDEVLDEILAALWAIVLQNYGAMISGTFRQQVEDSIDELFLFAARDGGFSLDQAKVGLLKQAAVSQLDTLIQETVLSREPQMRELLTSYLTTAGPREAAAATLAAAAGDSVMSAEVFQTELASLLTPEAPVSAAVDAWAYLWQNVAAVEAARDAGARAFEVVAVGGKLGDGRTTKFCRWAHGRIVPFSRIEAQLKGLRSSSLSGRAAAIVAAWPFLDSETARNGNELSFELFFRRAGLPPYHFGCRSKVRAIRIGR
jgi:hypothetical protein